MSHQANACRSKGCSKLRYSIAKTAISTKRLWGHSAAIRSWQTCKLNRINPWEYLVALQNNRKACQEKPEDWMPWNYQDRTHRMTFAVYLFLRYSIISLIVNGLVSLNLSDSRFKKNESLENICHHPPSTASITMSQF